METDQERLLSIGAVARAAGIPVDTLRTWERRYGFPQPLRMPSGHRRYHADVVDKLRLIAKAREMGVRAAETSQMTLRELEVLVGATAPAELEKTPRVWSVADWLECIRELDGPEFDAQLMREWTRVGAETLFDEVIGPLLVAVGEAWEAGALTVAHEHWASERIRDSLASHWRPLAARNRGPAYVCAALPGEQHDLGLQMLAVIVALAGAEPAFLGANTPLEGIASTAVAYQAKAVLVSVSVAMDETDAAAKLELLAGLLPPGMRLICGGSGAPHIDVATRITSWAELAGLLEAMGT